MASSIRQATASDIPAMTDLLARDAEQRNSLNPALWQIPGDMRARIEASIVSTLDNSAARQVWQLAKSSGRAVGIAHAMVVQVPPIYDIAAGSPGLLLDDCFTAADAPAGTAAALLAATETALRGIGAAGLIASCPATGPWRSVYEAHGYEPVTLYMAKQGFSAGPLPAGVRTAGPDDVAGIVERSADHRRTLSLLNQRFWNIHPQADQRFEAWMRYSLTLTDRDMMVAGAPGEVHGYVIAQPVPPLHVPAAHDIESIGVIDDFYDADFAAVLTIANHGATAASLLSAAQSAFARRGIVAALTVCPAAWTSKIALLEREGYRTAKLWMLKR
jgi:hypothetical protein